MAARYATEAQQHALRELVAQMRSVGTDQALRVTSDMSYHFDPSMLRVKRHDGFAPMMKQAGAAPPT